MASTLAEKIIARAASRKAVQVGEVVTCRVDLALMHDSGGPRRVKPLLEALGASVWDPGKIVVVTDHFVPAQDESSQHIVQIARDWCQETGIKRFYDEMGICHVIAQQQGAIQPGLFAVGGDSHSPSGGSLGCFMFGIGATEMLGVLVTGEIWLKVPATIRLDWHGQLNHGVTAKDMALYLAGTYGVDFGRYQALEYGGTAISSMNMDERMTLCNMSPEVGAQASLVAPDDTTRAYLQSLGLPAPSEQWFSDPDCVYLEHHQFDASALAPQIAAPFSPGNSRAISDYEPVRINTVYLGGCTGAKLSDLHAAARLLQGRRVDPSVKLLVAPASQHDQQIARLDGTLQQLLDAGALLQPTACGACAGYGAARFADDTVCLSTTARNFKGRMGTAKAQVYLGSPYSAAAAALTGQLTDPRELLAEAK